MPNASSQLSGNSVTEQPRPKGPRDQAASQSADLRRRSTLRSQTGVLATEFDLSEPSEWWLTKESVPAGVLNNSQIIYEVDTEVRNKRGKFSTTVKDVYVLFKDYSQTVITVEFNGSTVYSLRQEIIPLSNDLERYYGVSVQTLQNEYPGGDDFVRYVLDRVVEDPAPVFQGVYGRLIKDLNLIQEGDIASAPGGLVGIVANFDGQNIQVLDDLCRLINLDTRDTKVFRPLSRKAIKWDQLYFLIRFYRFVAI